MISVFFIISVIIVLCFYCIFTINRPFGSELYPSILTYLSTLSVYEWIILVMSFYYICHEINLSVMGAFLSVLYLLQRAYEFFHTEHLRIIDVINTTIVEHDDVKWKCSIIADYGMEWGNHNFNVAFSSIGMKPQEEFFSRNFTITHGIYVYQCAFEYIVNRKFNG